MIRGTLDNRRRTPEQCHICEFTFSKVLTSIKSNAIMRKKNMLRPFTSQFVSEAEPKLTNYNDSAFGAACHNYAF